MRTINNFASWIFADDVTAGTIPIEKAHDRRRESSETTERERTLMVLGTLGLWAGVVLISWP